MSHLSVFSAFSDSVTRSRTRSARRLDHILTDLRLKLECEVRYEARALIGVAPRVGDQPAATKLRINELVRVTKNPGIGPLD